MKTMIATAAAMFSLALAAPASAAGIVDGSFESQGPAAIGSNPGYCYLGSGPYTCGASSPWTGADGGGLQNESNPAWPGAATPSGEYYGFIQNQGFISQTFTLDAGKYSLSWLAAGRPSGCCGGNQSYNVLFDGVSIFSGSTTTGQAFTSMISDPFSVATSGSHTLTFQGLSTGGDNTAFIDNAMIAAVPEPATWAMMIMGFGLAGFALRRRRSIGAAAIA